MGVFRGKRKAPVWHKVRQAWLQGQGITTLTNAESCGIVEAIDA